MTITLLCSLALFGLVLWRNDAIIDALHLAGLLQGNRDRISYEIISQVKLLLATTCLIGSAVACRVDLRRGVVGVVRTLRADGKVLGLLFVILLVGNQFLRWQIWDGHLVDGLGGFYANMSLNPFHSVTTEATSSWFYRRMLMPLLAHLLQMKGPLLFGVFSLLLSGVLMATFKCILDRIHRFGFVELLSLFLLNLVNFSFLHLAYPDVLAANLVLWALFLDMQPRTRLILFSLALLTHDMATVVLFPYLFLFTDTSRRGLLVLAGGYALFWLAAHGFRPDELLGSQGTPSVLGMIRDFAGMYLLSFLPALGFLWIPYAAHLFQPWKLTAVWLRNLVLFISVVLLTLLGTDTARFTALLLPGCLLLWRTRGVNRFDVWMIRLSLLIPPFFSGIGNNSVYLPDLLLALQRWLDLPTFGLRLL